MTSKEFTIIGKVQGVFFRAECKRKADQFGVAGWVANNGDGSVTVHAEGNASAVRDLEEWCQVGPMDAQVVSLMSKEVGSENADSFEIVY